VKDVQPLWDDINNVPWEFVVFDEAHELKNSGAQIYNTLKTLECRKRYILYAFLGREQFSLLQLCAMDTR
jgi:hypothetical protein